MTNAAILQKVQHKFNEKADMFILAKQGAMEAPIDAGRKSIIQMEITLAKLFKNNLRQAIQDLTIEELLDFGAGGPSDSRRPPGNDIGIGSVTAATNATGPGK